MFDWVINTQLICNFVLPCGSTFLESPIEYENAIENMREFAAQEFLQNCYCLELLKVCEIFSIFDLVMCKFTAQKNISCQK